MTNTCDIYQRSNKEFDFCEINNTLKMCEECIKQINGVFARQHKIDNIKYIRRGTL